MNEATLEFLKELKEANVHYFNEDFFISQKHKMFYAVFLGRFVEEWGKCNQEELIIRLRSVRPEFALNEKQFVLIKNQYFNVSIEPEDFQDVRTSKLVLKDFKYFQKLKPDKTFLVNTMIYPKTTTMLYSPPGQFKSLLALDMALAVATGTDFLGMKCKKYPVLYCDKENNDQLLKDRLMGLWKGQGFKARNMPLKFLTRNGNLMDEDFVEKLKETIRENKFKLVFFDTLHRFADYEENKADDINHIYTQVFMPLVDELGCSVIFLHHSKKDGGYRGSGDLLGMVDTCYAVYRQGKTGKFEMGCEKSRAGEIENVAGEIDFSEGCIKIKRLSEALLKEKKTKVFLATVANVEGLFFGRDLKLSPKEMMERLEAEKVEFSPATVKRALAWIVEEKRTLVKEVKCNKKGLECDTGKYCLPVIVEKNDLIEEKGDFV